MSSKYLLVLLVMVIAAPIKAQTFGAEEDIKHPARLPAGILKILLKTEPVRMCLNPNRGNVKEPFGASWFQVAKVDLNGDRLADYVVKPENGCLFGANIVPFWVFRGTPKGFEKVLVAGVLGLIINKRKKTLGFYDIETVAATAVKVTTVSWVFDGKKYKYQRRVIKDL